ncbi:hypothetical protein GCM10010269_46980 [Streptomyces humidus]|uniref:Transposase n=2 Tax=Streptomyces humidus TaxID=52259 RepID=A0A918FZF4_9ACTN|nr:hypothetical protein GCM10010269_46980 [Streptomyces humidus]
MTGIGAGDQVPEAGNYPSGRVPFHPARHARERPTTMTTRRRSTSCTSTDPPVPGEVVLGVDTHGEVHVAAVISPLGKVLGTESFPATAAGYR